MAAETLIPGLRKKMCMVEVQHPTGNGATILDLKVKVSLRYGRQSAERLRGRDGEAIYISQHDT